MNHIAVDWGGRESQVCVVTSEGTVRDERRVRTRDLEEFLAKQPPGRVLIETAAASFALADAAKRFGHEVRVIPTMLVRSLGVGARRTKTDRRDAQALAIASARIELPSVHIPSLASRKLKSTCAARDALVRARTLLVNNVRGLLRTEGRRVQATAETLSARVRVKLDGGGISPSLERLLVVLDELTRQIRAADAELKKIARADELCSRLMGVPGVGFVTALRFKATLDDAGRFSSAHAVEAYLGLVPGEHSSSERKQRLSITKAGSTAMRATLVQAAWAAQRCRRVDPMVAWARQVESRRGKFVATVALARKLAGILFAMWRDGSRYDAQRTAATMS